MYYRITACLLAGLLATNIGNAQQTDTSQELQLNLDQFPDSNTPANKDNLQLNLEQFDSAQPETSDDLQLNLDQFDKSQDTNAPQDTQKGELNLDQFDNSNDDLNQDISTNGTIESGRTKSGNPSAPTYNYKRIFIVSAAVFLVFLYVFSRRRKRRV